VAEAAAHASDLVALVYVAGSGTEHHQVACDRSREIEGLMCKLGLPLTVLRPVVTDPQVFRGREHVTVAGDEATPRSMAMELERDLGEPVRLTEVQVEGVFMYPDAVGHAHDLDWLRGVYPGLQTLREWLTACGSDVCRSMVGVASGGAPRD
jgi:hypothetical protein